MNAAARERDAGDSELDERSWKLGWLIAASVTLHIALIVTMPDASRATNTPLPTMVVEVAELPRERPPPPEPPTPPPPEPEPSPSPATPVTTRSPLAATASPTSPQPAATAEAANEAAAEAANEAAADFTGTLMTNDGQGIGVRAGVAGGGGGGTGKAPTPATIATARPAGPKFVAAGNLSKPPRPPSLDGALERNYPTDAKRAGIAGRAVLRVTIRADGRVGRVERVSESWQGFGEACEKTVRSAPWEPPIDRDGAMVETEITYTCRFEIRS